MKIGILGSACNPPHNGHIAIGEYVRIHAVLDRMLLVPGHISPEKGMLSASPDDRLSMARLAVKDLTYWTVSDIEIKKKGISYTKDTIGELKHMYPDDELFWIIGLDNLVKMKNGWKGGYSVLDMCRFIVVPRYLYSFDSIPSHIRKKVIFKKDAPTRIISSTRIRNSIAKGGDKSSYLHKNVYEYIKKNKLYI